MLLSQKHLLLFEFLPRITLQIFLISERIFDVIGRQYIVTVLKPSKILKCYLVTWMT